MKLLISILLGLIYNVFSRSTDTLGPDDYPTEVEKLPSACNDLEDGFHWIRPLVDSNDEYPNIYVECNNGYTILNPSLFDFYNYHHIKSLFTSYSELSAPNIITNKIYPYIINLLLYTPICIEIYFVDFA